ncbi:glycosyltransferase family 39 protein [Chitinibacter sp. FCG-7]|uniref:Glycosyltransferase family 39 protein n=1 Tax=Chitinibacter mangrovi TaxID=3153927 RepID=A0AAU7FCZ1_9NEIS
MPPSNKLLRQLVPQSIYLIFAAIFSIFLAVAFFVDAFWKSDTWFSRGDLQMLGPQNPLLQALGIAVWFLVLYGAWRVAKRLDQSQFIRLIIAGLFLGFFGLINLFIYYFPVHAYDDALVIRIVVDDLLRGNFISFFDTMTLENKAKNYLYLFPLQVPFTLYTYAIHNLIGDSYTWTRIINTIWITGSSYVIYQIYLLWQQKRHDFFAALICTTFIPFILLGAWVYNDFPAIFLSCIAIYFFTLWQQQGRKRAIILCLIALAFANLFRPIALLLALSFALIIVLRWIKSGQYKPDQSTSAKVLWQGVEAADSTSSTTRRDNDARKLLLNYLWILFGLFIAIQLPHKLVNGALALGGVPTYSGLSTSAPAPKWMWLNIGYDYKRLGVWSYNEAYSTFVSEAPIDEDAVNTLFKQEIAKKWQEIGLTGTLSHWAKKTYWQWTEGTYQAVYYGIGDPARPDYFAHPTAATQFAHGEHGETFRYTVRRITQLQNWLYLFAATCVVVLAFKRASRDQDAPLDETLLLLAFYTLMVFGMYMLWESKSRYILSSTIPLLLLASYGLPQLFARFEAALKATPEQQTTMIEPIPATETQN